MVHTTAGNVLLGIARRMEGIARALRTVSDRIGPTMFSICDVEQLPV